MIAAMLLSVALLAQCPYSGDTLVGFTSDTCGICPVQKEVWKELARDKIKIRVVEEGRRPAWAAGVAISIYPTTILYRDGVEAKRLTGLQSKEQILALLAKRTATAQALREAGLAYTGAHVAESEEHPLLQELASGHAAAMAATLYQDHAGFQSRYEKIAASIPGAKAAEIVAESWARQANDPLAEIGAEMFRCWQYSAGHWSVASVKHKYAGMEMAKGSDGRYFACILVAD
jgi:thioredoxin 1